MWLSLGKHFLVSWDTESSASLGMAGRLTKIRMRKSTKPIPEYLSCLHASLGPFWAFWAAQAWSTSCFSFTLLSCILFLSTFPCEVQFCWTYSSQEINSCEWFCFPHKSVLQQWQLDFGVEWGANSRSHSIYHMDNIGDRLSSMGQKFHWDSDRRENIVIYFFFYLSPRELKHYKCNISQLK